MIKSKLNLLITLGLIAATATPIVVYAEDGSKGIQHVDNEQKAAAVGHYARSKSLLIAAINEFDRGAKIANPNAIINSGQWRSDLVDRASELDHILDPQPRASHGGIQYGADTRLLNEAIK